MEKLWFGDWFILLQLCKNMNPTVFHDLVTDLRDRYFIFKILNLKDYYLSSTSKILSD